MDEEIHIPPAVHEEVPSNILWDAQSILDPLHRLIHEQLCLLQTKRVPHWHLQHCQEKLLRSVCARIRPDMEKRVTFAQGGDAQPSDPR